MEQPLYLDNYLKYLDRNPNVKAIKHFKCGAIRGERVRFFSTAPAGECFLYPEFLIFLTKSKAGAGLRTFFTNAWNLGDATFLRWAKNPMNILVDVAKSIHAFASPKQLDKMLANPNSIFVPLSQLRSIQTGRDWTQGNYIILNTNNGDIVLVEHISDYPNPINDLKNGRKPSFVTPQFLYRKVKGHITGEWQADVVAALRAHLQPPQMATYANRR
jgi:hypothetical protein